MYHFIPPLYHFSLVSLGSPAQAVALDSEGRCGTFPSMPRHLPEKEIEDAAAAVAYAQQVRAYHRRRSARTSDQRVKDVEMALKRLKAAMKPLKSEIGRFPYGPQTTQAEANREIIRQAAADIKRERIKLWKMLPKKP